MPVSIPHLKSKGCYHGNYKRIFSQPYTEYPKPVKKLVDLLASRFRSGVQYSLKDWRALAAIDLACEASLNQTTPTLVSHILSKHLGLAETEKALEDWGMSKDTLFMDVRAESGEMVKTINPPMFFKILIPLVVSYVKAVLAQLYDERNQKPFLPYNPLKETHRNRVLCDIITDLMETLSTWYGYPAVLRQAIDQSLKYGIAIAFPREEWHCEEHVDETGATVTQKEGIRYVIPPPDRTAYDLTHPLTTLNTDTGTEWILHWKLLNYGEILDNRLYWNKKDVFAGTNWFQAPFIGSYFDEVFPCQMNFLPNCQFQNKREDRAAYYGTTDRDKAVFVGEIFSKIIPRDFGLGRYEGGKLVDTYSHPVWHRFTLAGDSNVIWAQPNAYTPGIFFGYDYVANSASVTSLALELIPWQDHLGQIISQMVLTAQQNLDNTIFYDTEVVDKKDIEKIRNSGERRYRGMNFVGYSSLMRKMSQTGIAQAFIPVQLGKQSIQELLQLIPTILNIMERVLGITAQDAGAAASHQQSKEEVMRTGKSSATRRALTAAGIDEGIDAWKRQLHDGFQAYGDASVTAQVSADIENLAQHLEELGFKIRHRGSDKIMVTGSKTALRLEGFARSGEGPTRPNDKEVAAVLFQVCGTIAGQPDLFKEVGPKVILHLLEEGARLAGADRDFSLNQQPGEKQDEVPPKVIELLKQVQDAILKQVTEGVAQPAAKQSAAMEQQIVQLAEQVKKLTGIYAEVEKTQQSEAVKAKESQAKVAVLMDKHQKEEQRRQESHAAKMRRDEEAAKTKLAIETAEAQTRIGLETAESKVKSKIKAAEAASKPKPSSNS